MDLSNFLSLSLYLIGSNFLIVPSFETDTSGIYIPVSLINLFLVLISLEKIKED